MRTIDIITSDMSQLHGANKVTEKLINGKNIFYSNGFILRNLISKNGILDCSKYQSLMGTQLNNSSYIIKRKIIDNLKKLSVYNSYYIQTAILKRYIQEHRAILKHYNTLDKKPDLIIFQDPVAAYICLKHGHNNIPSIFISHAANDPLEQTLLNRPAIKGKPEEKELRNIYDCIFSSVSKVITICNSAKEFMMKRYKIDCPCILNGIEDIPFEFASRKTYANQELNIIILASVHYRKGHDLAIQAMSELNQNEKNRLTLHIAGEGKDLNAFKTLAKSLNLEKNIVFHGSVLNVVPLLNKMDAFLLPSRADTVPVAIIEALRSGLPVFASNVGEIPQMIEGCGISFPLQVEQITTIYRSLLANKYDLEQMSRLSRTRYLKVFNLESMITKYCNVLSEL